MEYRAPRGTLDILGEETKKWQWIEQEVRNVCLSFNYHEVRTPYFEETQLFKRGVGETTDIVEKEMYSFEDRAQRGLTLRPEGTAGVVRAFVENKVYNTSNLTKWYYMGPMFRYERPQAGRNRQFHQFGVEAFGSNDPAIDAEVIALGCRFFENLGLQGVRVIVNSVGSLSSRKEYQLRLTEYFGRYEDQLPEEAKVRLLKNPMRLLDSKNPVIKDISKHAPSILECLSEEDQLHFAEVRSYLDALDVPYDVDHRLVRGLDYYQQTAFEYMLDMPGSQASTLGGGGRYLGLVEDLGGPSTPGIGFGIGLDRVLLALDHQGIQLPISTDLDCYVIGIGETVKQHAIQIVQELRVKGFSVETDYLQRKMKAQLKTADRLHAKFVVIIGEDEFNTSTVQLRDLKSGEQVQLTTEEMIDKLEKSRVRVRE